MSKAVPHFSEEWLKSYNERLRASERKPVTKTENNPERKTEARGKPPTDTHAREGEPEGKMAPHTPAKRTAVPFRAYGGKQTKTEERYNAVCLGGLGRFEAVCLYLPGGGRYTPDFMTVDDGRITFHEVKGSYRLGSQGRAHTAFQEAAAAFPCFTFVWAVESKAKGNFDVKRIEPVAIGEGTKA